MRRFSLFGLLVVTTLGCAHPPPRGSIVPALLGGFGDALACGGSLLLDALAKRAGPADYLDASGCFIERQLHRYGERMEAAPAPSEDHGRRVVEAARAADTFRKHPCERHEHAAAEALRACGWEPAE